MRRKWLVAAIVVAAFAGSYAWKSVMLEHRPVSRRNDGLPARIVSLAPSITETLFALGAGDMVVGVTRYCNYPPSVRDKARVGGLEDPNSEAIIALKPDLVIAFPEHEQLRELFRRFGIRTLLVKHDTIAEILESITAIGRQCDREQRARQLTGDIRGRIDRIRLKTNGLKRSRVMITLGRNMGTQSIKDAYIAGQGGFYHEMIEFAGGQNAYSGSIAFPIVSKEGMLRMNPEVVIDMIPESEKKGISNAAILAEWGYMKEIDAVKNNAVHIFNDDFAVIPGPRFILLLEKMARVIHPEAGWEAK